MDLKREKKEQRVMLSLSPLYIKVKDKTQRSGEQIYSLCPWFVAVKTEKQQNTEPWVSKVDSSAHLTCSDVLTDFPVNY